MMKTIENSFVKNTLQVRWIMFAILLAVSLYYNIGYDLLLIGFMFATAYSLGQIITRTIMHRNYEDSLVFTIGIGCLGFLVWFVVMMNYQMLSILALGSVAVIILERESLKKCIYEVTSNENSLQLCIGMFLFIMLIPSSAYPVAEYDALAKHVVIPNRIANGVKFDYNVIESITYGDYAILPHMLFSYLMILKGTKAITLLVTLLSIIGFTSIYKIIREFGVSKLSEHSAIFVYFSTPIIYYLSTILYVDMIMIFFVLPAIYISVCWDREKVFESVGVVALLCGLAFYSKPNAIVYVAPVVMVTAVKSIMYAFNEKLEIMELFKQVILGIFWGCIAFFPSMAVVYYKTRNPLFPMMNNIFKSPYFPTGVFLDPFPNELGLNITSLLSIVFDTRKNFELHDGAIGYYPLLIILVPLLIWLYRKETRDNMRKLFLLIVVSLGGYYLALKFAFNIRYFLTSIILFLPLVIISVDKITHNLKKNQNLVLILVFIGLMVPNAQYIMDHLIYPDVLSYHPELTKGLSNNILADINRKDVRILVYLDELRGEFIGEYYGLTWYNTFLYESLNEGRVSAVELLDSCDYYLEYKLDDRYNYLNDDYFSRDREEIRNKLELVAEDGYYKLFKVNRNVELKKHKYAEPIVVNVETPDVYSFEREYDEYQIVIDCKADDPSAQGRWQINWYDENNNLVDLNLIPFNVVDENQYVSPWMQVTENQAKYGVLYINSHSQIEIEVSEYVLNGRHSKSDNFISNLVRKYNR